jgi:hypothetical protein
MAALFSIFPVSNVWADASVTEVRVESPTVPIDIKHIARWMLFIRNLQNFHGSHRFFDAHEFIMFRHSMRD